jgi:DnaJ-class molecular chaperone
MTKEYMCPVCNGYGGVMIARMYPSGHTECWEPEPCDFCEGEGQFEESDYLIMKLEGIV